MTTSEHKPDENILALIEAHGFEQIPVGDSRRPSKYEAEWQAGGLVYGCVGWPWFNPLIGFSHKAKKPGEAWELTMSYQLKAPMCEISASMPDVSVPAGITPEVEVIEALVQIGLFLEQVGISKHLTGLAIRGYRRRRQALWQDELIISLDEVRAIFLEAAHIVELELLSVEQRFELLVLDVNVPELQAILKSGVLFNVAKEVFQPLKQQTIVE